MVNVENIVNVAVATGKISSNFGNSKEYFYAKFARWI